MELEDIVTVVSSGHDNQDSMSSFDMMSAAASVARDRIEELENHVDVLHTKLSAAEDRIAILESIVLKNEKIQNS